MRLCDCVGDKNATTSVNEAGAVFYVSTRKRPSEDKPVV